MTEQPTALRLADELENEGDSWFRERDEEAAAELRRLYEEASEQARLLGISAERELALLARIDRLEKANEAFGKRQEWWNQRMFTLEQQRDELLEALHWIAARCPAQLMDHPLHGIHKEIAHDAGACARAAIAKAGATK